MKTIITLGLLIALIATNAIGIPSIYRPITNDPLPEELIPSVGTIVYPPYEDSGIVYDYLTDETFQVGTTWYESQATGTVGQKIDVDSAGNVHIVWTNGLNSGASSRHIYYNEVTPQGQVLFPNGTQIDPYYRGGYPVLDTRYGNLPFIWYHATLTQGGQNAIVTWVNSMNFEIIGNYLWPQAQWGYGTNPRFHLLAMENVGIAGVPQSQFYIWGTYNPQSGMVTYAPSWTEFEPSQTIAYTVGTSRTSNKVAFAWTHCREPGYPGQPGQTFTQMNNDVYLVIDEDGQNISFANPLNVTNFIGPDTLRAYTDIDVFIDHNNYVHVAFTTRAYFHFQQTSYWNSSIIWHWCEQYPDTFKMIANAFNPNDVVDCGAWQLKAQRPSLGEGLAPNYKLYCAYHRYDTDSTHLSAAGYPSGEVYISVTTNNGLSWSQGINVTSTLTPYLAPPGSCNSELCPSMAETVDNYCHLVYVLDKDAGNVIQTEGNWTLNPVIYNRVPVAAIPTTPLLPQIYSLHVDTTSLPPYPIQVLLTPFGTPIVIPPGGGSFNFNVALGNTTTLSCTTDAWSSIKTPSGTMIGPVLGPLQNLTLSGSGSINRNRTQSIPGHAPAGSYQYIAYAGDYLSPTNYTVGDSAFFPFTKTGIDAEGIYQSWLAGGEEFADLVITWAHSRAPLQSVDLQVSISPNPFNPVTTISFELRAASCVKFEVFDVKGQRVGTGLVPVQGGGRTPALQWYNAGPHQIKFDGSGLPSGVYLYRIQSEEGQAIGKLVLMK